MIRALLISGDRQTSPIIIPALSDYCPRVHYLGEAGSIREAIPRMTAEQPDLIILDTKLPDGSGYELFRHADPAAYKIIILSNHIEYALNAFKIGAVDFLLKPPDAEELAKAVNKACDLIGNEEKLQSELLAEHIRNLNRKEKIILKTFDHVHIINQDEIIRIEADKNYSTFYIVDGRKILVSRSIKEFEDLLDDKGFFRIHKSHLINMSRIRYFDKAEGGYVVMSDGVPVPVASRKRDMLLGLFDRLA